MKRRGDEISEEPIKDSNESSIDSTQGVELKTLKDLEKLCNCGGKFGGICECNEPTSNTLRQEAIKWVKKCDDGVWINEGNDKIHSIEDWIEHFFNIKESDLKDEKDKNKTTQRKE